MVKVIIEMDESWRWHPAVDGEIRRRRPDKARSQTIELPDAFLAEYRRVSKRFQEMQEYLEHCYRHQEGLTPFNDSPFNG